MKKLSDEERELLYIDLLKGMEIAPPEAEKVWEAETQKRLQEIQEGKIKTIPVEKVLADGRKMLNFILWRELSTWALLNITTSDRKRQRTFLKTTLRKILN
ncbi:putative addiction module component [Leptospira weilii serovar Ranarum str. ICFT]|uniref:Addiction module component n=1 Tax=Leptospira weilii serovar Ranarum str. ICFT TaxID=1218598 RepID=N1WE97_9LEPT|nr:addiction module protein [Leptospira weilii]EMY77280.1 putative addiction module component [Leptospira weilii serovar Ranarum str. ICFT]